MPSSKERSNSIGTRERTFPLRNLTLHIADDVRAIRTKCVLLSQIFLLVLDFSILIIIIIIIIIISSKVAKQISQAFLISRSETPYIVSMRHYLIEPGVIKYECKTFLHSL